MVAIMNGIKLSWWSLVMLMLASEASSYELSTHGLLTHNGYELSVLSTDEALLKGLGLIDTRSIDAPFGTEYYELTSGGNIDWTVDPAFEDQVIRQIKPKEIFQDKLKIPGWLMRGAVREDDYKSGIKYGVCYLPRTNPDNYATIMDRPLNHFFDPINDKGMLLGDKSPDWGTGAESAFSSPLIKDNDGSDNHFSIFQAREAQYRALAGFDGVGNPISPSDVATSNKYWATLFRSLGDLVHLIQDMAQPQHTRDDAHSGACLDGGVFSGHKSVYEEYMEQIVLQPDMWPESLSCFTRSLLPPLNTYPVPRFNDYASYFSTRHLDAEGLRRGMADYSNYGFFSIGTNMNNKYSAPSNNAVSYTAVYINPPCMKPGYSIKELQSDVLDQQEPGYAAANVPLTTESLWFNSGVTFAGGITEYTLTRSNYDAMAAYLLPRAVAYSAGIINYFFRGRLDLQVDTFSSSNVSVKFRNNTYNEVLYGQRDDGTGTTSPSSLMLVYEYTDESGQVQTGFADAPKPMDETVIVPFGEWDATSYTFDFTNDPIPSGVTEIRFRLIFRGHLGNEWDAIAVGYVDATSPGFVFTPTVTPSDGIGGGRWMYKDQGKWTLDTELTGLQGGNIDWKGRYVDGVPSVVLSWMGPKGRSIPEVLDQGIEPSSFGVNVYKDGELYAVSPFSVHGALVYTDSLDSDWLIAICRDGTDDVVLKKPNIQNTSPAFYDPETAPNGWQEVRRFNRQSEVSADGYVSLVPDQPWLANGSGTEAQTTWLVRSPSAGREGADLYYRARLKLTIQDGSATPEFIDPIGGQDIVAGKALIAIDYFDNEELRLEIDENLWLTVNGIPLISDPGLVKVKHFNQYPESISFVESTSLTELGLNSADYNKEETTGVYVTIYYIDLRNRSVGMSVSNALGDVGLPTSGKRYLLKDGKVKSFDEWANGSSFDTDVVYTIGLGSPDEQFGKYYFTNGWFNDYGMATPSIPNCAVSREGSLLCSTSASYGVLNYLEGGDAESTVGVPDGTLLQNISPK